LINYYNGRPGGLFEKVEQNVGTVEVGTDIANNVKEIVSNA
jgi:hypothetical protein